MLTKLRSKLNKISQFSKLAPDYFLLRFSRLFDKKWYLEKNPDVSLSRIDPVWHYLTRGGFEGRDPSIYFSSSWYLNNYEDVKKIGVNPLVHYIKLGRNENRQILPTNNDEEYTNLMLIKNSGFFDEKLYLRNNPDVAEAKIPPLIHYLLYGGQEGRDLPPHFYSQWYLDYYQEVQDAGINPLIHYLKYGQTKGYRRGPLPLDLRFTNYSKTIYIKTLINELINSIDRMYEIPPSGNPFFEYITDLLQDINQKREEIFIKQSKGAWPISSSNTVLIKYLDDIKKIIRPLVRKKKITKQTINKIKEKLITLIEKLDDNHNLKIKVVFFTQEASIWPSFASVYKAFVANPSCNVQLVHIPYRHKNNDEKMDPFRVYKNMGLPIRRWSSYNLSQEAPDIAFFAKPYGSVPVNFRVDNVSLVVERCVYIPYWVNWMALQNIPFLIDFHFRMPLFEIAWKIFDAPDYVYTSHVEYGPQKGKNVELLGHPRFDAIRHLEKVRDRIPEMWKEKISGKIVVMWNTHSFIPDKKEEDWSTFGIFGNNILEYFKIDRKIVLLWRPHPHFFNSLITSDLMTVDEVEELKTWASNNPNIILDTTPDYLSAFSIADALISDASSLLVEFLLTHKPVLYTFNDTSRSIVNENLLSAFYEANTWDGVNEFLQMLIHRKDHKPEERIRVVEKFMPNADKNVGELVMKKCIDDLISEETDAAQYLSKKYATKFTKGTTQTQV